MFRRVGVSAAAGLALLTAAVAPTFAASSQVSVQLPFNRQVYASSAPKEPSTCKQYDSTPTTDQCVPYFDLAGDALPTSSAPSSPVSAKATDGNTVSFTLAPTSGKDALSLANGASQAISVKAGKYSQLDILAGAGNGPAPLSFTFTYSDGSTSTATTSVPDWYKGTPAFAVTYSGRWVPGTTSVQSGNLGLYALSIPVDASKTLTGVKVTNTATTGEDVANILSATLEGSASGSASTATTTTSTSTSTSGAGSSLPKTGGSPLVPLAGVLALGMGGALVLRRRHSVGQER